MRREISALITAFILIIGLLFYVSEVAVNYTFTVLDETEQAVELNVLADGENIYSNQFEADEIASLPGPTEQFEATLNDNFNLVVQAEPLNDAVIDIDKDNGTYVLIMMRGNAVFVEQSDQPFLMQ